MTEVGSCREVGTPHILKVSRDVASTEQTLALYEAVVFWRLILSDECCVGVCAVNLDRVVVIEEFYACDVESYYDSNTN